MTLPNISSSVIGWSPTLKQSGVCVCGELLVDLHRKNYVSSYICGKERRRIQQFFSRIIAVSKVRGKISKESVRSMKSVTVFLRRLRGLLALVAPNPMSFILYGIHIGKEYL